MKAAWQIKTLGEVCKVVNGGTPKTGVKEYWDGEHLWITPAEMGKRLNPYADDTARKITSQGLRDSSARLLPLNSVILSSRAPIGHLVINTKPMATNQGCKGLVPSESLACKYLFYFLQANVDFLNDLGSGATFKELSGGKLKEVKISLAPLTEQQRIVAILDQAFEGIAKARANSEQNLQNARALFESHLQSVFTQRGGGWTEKPLEQVSKVVSGYSFKSSDFSSTNQIKTIKITNVGVKEFVNDFDSLLPSNFKNKYEAFSVNKGSIVIALTRTIIQSGLKVAVVPSAYDGALLNQRVAAIVANSKYVIDSYIYLYLSTKQVEHYVKSHVNTLMQPNLSINDLKALPIPLPTIFEQEKIVEDLETLSKETQRLETLYQRKIVLLGELKKSLLQQAFAGEL